MGKTLVVLRRIVTYFRAAWSTLAAHILMLLFSTRLRYTRLSLAPKCPKCGHRHNPHMDNFKKGGTDRPLRYDFEKDLVVHDCGICGFVWGETPIVAKGASLQ